MSAIFKYRNSLEKVKEIFLRDMSFLHVSGIVVIGVLSGLIRTFLQKRTTSNFMPQEVHFTHSVRIVLKF